MNGCHSQKVGNKHKMLSLVFDQGGIIWHLKNVVHLTVQKMKKKPNFPLIVKFYTDWKGSIFWFENRSCHQQHVSSFVFSISFCMTSFGWHRWHGVCWWPSKISLANKFLVGKVACTEQSFTSHSIFHCKGCVCQVNNKETIKTLLYWSSVLENHRQPTTTLRKVCPYYCVIMFPITDRFSAKPHIALLSRRL